MSRFEIDKSKVREALEARDAPYFGAPLETGLYVGFRRLADGGTWVCRYRPAGARGQKMETLGVVSPRYDYSAACKDALKVKARLDDGLLTPKAEAKMTVWAVVELYLAALLVKGPNKAKAAKKESDARRRLENHLKDHPLAKRPAATVTEAQFGEWIDGVKAWGKKAPSATTKDRIGAALKSALNYGARKELIPAACANRWAEGLPKSGLSNARDVYLSVKQRQALLASCLLLERDRSEIDPRALQDLVAAVTHTGMRFGEAQKLTPAHYDPRTQVLSIPDGKTGARQLPVTAEAHALFVRLRKSKLPSAPLLPGYDGGFWKHEYCRDLKRVVKIAKLDPKVNLYTLRHSWITDALQANVPVSVVAQLCGTSEAMIRKHYFAKIPSLSADHVARLKMA